MQPSLQKNNKNFISSIDASVRFGITNDYVSLLCRQGKVAGERVGRQWFVEPSSLETFLAQMQVRKAKLGRKLSHQIREEYATLSVTSTPAIVKRVAWEQTFAPKRTPWLYTRIEPRVGIATIIALPLFVFGVAFSAQAFESSLSMLHPLQLQPAVSYASGQTNPLVASAAYVTRALHMPGAYVDDSLVPPQITAPVALVPKKDIEASLSFAPLFAESLADTTSRVWGSSFGQAANIFVASVNDFGGQGASVVSAEFNMSGVWNAWTTALANILYPVAPTALTKLAFGSPSAARGVGVHRQQVSSSSTAMLPITFVSQLAPRQLPQAPTADLTGYVTQKDLSAQLNDITAQMRNLIYNQNAVSTSSLYASLWGAIALSSRIDSLPSSVTINNSPIVTQQTIPALSELSGLLGIGHGGTGTGTAPIYGQMLVGNASGGYDLVATSSLGLQAGGSSNTFSFPLINSAGTVSLAFGTTTANTWANMQKFTGGVLSLASSTIGNGTQTGGLTISGGATTTGNAYFAGNVGVGTTSPFTTFSVNGGGFFGGSLTVTNLTATGTLTLSSALGVTSGGTGTTSASGATSVLQFLQATTSSVTRSVQSKLADTISVKDFGAAGNTLSYKDGTITVGSNAFSSASATFTSADVGKTIYIDYAGSPGSPLQTTITGFTDSHHITIGANAVTSVPYSFLRGVFVATTQSGAGSYAPGDTITLSGGTASSVAVLTVNRTKVITATINNGGTGGTTAAGASSGACTLTGTTGSGERKFSINAVLVNGAVTVLQNFTSTGEYSANPTSLTAEPVTGCGSLSGATLTLVMGVLMPIVTTQGTYSATAATLTQSSTSGSGTGATFTSLFVTGGSFTYGTDDTNAISTAFNYEMQLDKTGTPKCIYMPSGVYLVTSALPTFYHSNGCVMGDGSNKTSLQAAPSLTNDVLSWSEDWAGVGGTAFGAPSPLLSQQTVGPVLKNIGIAGDQSSGNIQHAVTFYDRNDQVDMENVSVSFMTGSCLRMGYLKNTTQSYVRESQFNNIHCFDAGTSTAPAIDVNTNSNADGTNELDFNTINIYAPYGPGFVIHSVGPSGTRGIHVNQLRVEGEQGDVGLYQGDLVRIGDSSTSAINDSIQFTQLHILNPYLGYAAFKVTADSAADQPYYIDVTDGDIDAAPGYGRALELDAGRFMNFEFNGGLNSIDYNLYAGPSPLLGGSNIVSNGNNESSLYAFIASSSVASVMVPNGQTIASLASGAPSNVAFGVQALGAATSSLYNTAIGYQALTVNASGVSNTALGFLALAANTSGNNNTATGYVALGKNTIGVFNTASGFGALGSNTSGSNNSGFGVDAFANTSTGSNNVGVGENAGFWNQTGSGNTAIGSFTDGIGNNAVGNHSNNTELGLSAGYMISTGSRNLFLGANMASTTATGNNNIAIGYDVALPSINGSNQLDIGNLLFGTGINGEGTNLSTGNIGIGTSSPMGTLAVGSGQIVAVGGGAVTSGGYVFSNSLNTGMYSPAASDLRLSTNGVDVFRSAGNSNYSASLSISSGFNTIPPANGLYVAGNTGLGTSSPFAKLSVHANNGDTNTTLFAIGSSTQSATSTLFSISNIGNVTIPNNVAYSALTTTGGTQSLLTLDAANNTDVLVPPSGKAGFYNGNYKILVNGDSASLLSDGAFAWSNSVSLNSGTYDTGLSRLGADKIAVGNGTANDISGTLVANTIGVGTTSPFAKLSVQANNGDTNTTLFAIGSSTQSATSTLFSISNTGTVAINAGPAGGQNFTFSANSAINTAQLLSNTSNLTIGSSVGGGALNLEASNSIGATLTSNGNFGIGSSTPWGQLSINPNGIAGPAFVIGSSTATLFTVTNGGNVGIGTSTPNYLLHVVTSSNTATPFVVVENTSQATAATADIRFRTGNHGVDNGYISEGYNGLTTYLALGESNSCCSNAVETMRLLNNSVAIGTTTPYSKLSVWGANTTAGTKVFEVTNSASTTSFSIDNAGFISAGSSNGTNPSNLFTIDTSSGTTTVANLSVGNIVFDTDAGLVGLSDIPVDSSVAANVRQAQSISIGGNPLITASAIANGSGGLTNFGVAIGTSTNPYSMLQVWGPDAASSTPAFTIVNNSSTTVFAVFDGGNAQLSGTLTQSSDQRLKTNITSLDASSTLAALTQLNPVTFNWIDTSQGSTPQIGFIAQQVQQIFPNLVSTSTPTPLTPNGTLGVNYIGFVAPIIEAIKALVTEVNNFATQFTTHKLCVADDSGAATCITKAQLDALLQGAGQQAAAASPTPPPADPTPAPAPADNASSTPSTLTPSAPDTTGTTTPTN